MEFEMEFKICFKRELKFRYYTDGTLDEAFLKNKSNSEIEFHSEFFIKDF